VLLKTICRAYYYGQFASTHNDFCIYAAPSSPPTNFSGTALSSRSILLSWGMPPIEGQNGVITGYNVSTIELETEEVTEVFTESYKLTLDSLQPYATYGFLVSARTVAGSGPSTQLLYVRTDEEGNKWLKQACFSFVSYIDNIK